MNCEIISQSRPTRMRSVLIREKTKSSDILTTVREEKHLFLYYFYSLRATFSVARDSNYRSGDHVRSDIKYSMFTFSEPLAFLSLYLPE